MAESVCLRRSFSNPAAIIHGIHEGDPARILGESVSFGRYVSDSLAWERFSAFSRNRYLEEVEKYSKPGSVAKMKAFFEAHYSQFGSKKRAAQEEANNEISGVEAEAQNNIENMSCHTTICEIGAKRRSILEETNNESSKAKVQNTIESSRSLDSPVYELRGEKMALLEPQSSPIVGSRASLFPINQVHILESRLKSSTTDGSFEIQVHERKDVAENRGEFPEKKVSQCMEVQEKNDIINHTQEKKLPVKEVEKKNTKSSRKSADSPIKQRRRKTEDSPVKQHGRKTEDSPLKQHGRKTEASPPKQSVKSNVSKLSSSLARLSTPVRPKTEGRDTPDGRKLGNESVDKRKSASKSTNVSTNTDVKKNSSMSSRKIGIGKIFTPLGKIIRDRFTSPAPSKESRNSVVRHPCATPQSEIKRSKVALEKSFPRSKTLDQNLKSPATGNSSVQSTSVYPFKLRTEERAEKRRELLQKKLEKEAENSQQPPKVKPETKKSSLGVNLKASASTNIRTEVLSDNTKKIAPPRTPLPKHRSKPASDQKQPTFSQTSHKTITSKLGSEKIEQVSSEPSSKLRSEKSNRVSTESSSKPCSEKSKSVSTQSSSKLGLEKSKPVQVQPNSKPGSEKSKPVSVQSSSKLSLEKSKPVSVQSSSKLSLEKSKPVSVQSSSKPDSGKSKLVSTHPSPKPCIEQSQTVSTKSSTMPPMKKLQENTSPNVL